MKTFQDFYITGRGYLNDILKQGDLVRICMIQHLAVEHESETEEVWLDCKVNNLEIKRLLLKLKEMLSAGNAMIIKFLANYQEFLVCHHGQTEDDIDRIVHLKAELCNISEVHVNGMRISLAKAENNRAVM